MCVYVCERERVCVCLSVCVCVCVCVCVGWPTVPPFYNAPVFAASAVNMMAAQSVSIDKYPDGEQQVGLAENLTRGSDFRPARPAQLCKRAAYVHLTDHESHAFTVWGDCVAQMARKRRYISTSRQYYCYQFGESIWGCA